MMWVCLLTLGFRMTWGSLPFPQLANPMCIYGDPAYVIELKVL